MPLSGSGRMWCPKGGDAEPALTKALIKEMEAEFRALSPRMKVLGGGGAAAKAPILTMTQRPLSAIREEPIYGCDIAFIVQGKVPGRYDGTWVELVQVKKTSALHGVRSARPRTDSWRIECDQLQAILRWSATAVYWLIASAGEVLAVPARHLDAIRVGTEKAPGAKTFTVGYHEVRAAAIPLDQYLGDLLIGQWVGTASTEVLEIARGNNDRIRPKIVLEVSITVGRDVQG